MQSRKILMAYLFPELFLFWQRDPGTSDGPALTSAEGSHVRSLMSSMYLYPEMLSTS